MFNIRHYLLCDKKDAQIFSYIMPNAKYITQNTHIQYIILLAKSNGVAMFLFAHSISKIRTSNRKNANASMIFAGLGKKQAFRLLSFYFLALA